jgi:hypothetical protein
MKIYNVHIYREMGLAYGGIEAGTHEEAAATARDKPTDQADSIDDCDGETIAALVDVVGDEQYAQSRVVDFEPERRRRTATDLQAALTWLLDDLTDAGEARNPETGDEYDSVAFGRAALARSKSTGILSESAAPSLRTALEFAVQFLESNDDGEEDVMARIAVAKAALAEAAARGVLPDRSVVARVLYDTLAYVAEMLSGFKPDFLANIGLDVAMEKTLVALHAAEALPPALPANAGAADPRPDGESARQPHSVLLLYPDYANDGGTETYYAWVAASGPIAAIAEARRQAMATNGWTEEDVNPDDFVALLVIEGHHRGQPTSND